MNTEITRKKIDELLCFLPMFEKGGPETEVEFVGGGKTSDGGFILPYALYSPAVIDFFERASNVCWCDFDYQTKNVREMLDSPEAIAHADLEQMKSMLTYCVRGERFCTGHWLALIQSGAITSLLRRLKVLRDELCK